jgi:lysophospholipase L1-like esterase
MKRITLAALATSTSLCLAGAAHAEWLESWGASPLPPTLAGGFFGPSPSFENQTIRQVVRLSAGGSSVRVSLTNEYGSAPLKVGAATVSLSDAAGTPIGEPIALTFSGMPSAEIPPGAPLYSDTIDLPVEALQSLSISVYFPEATGPCTCHLTGAQTAYISGPGDFTQAGAFEPASTLTQRVFLGAVDVWTAGEGKTIVALGDSITDGVGATTDGNDRWPDRLAERLAERGGDVSLAVSNQGVSGNRLLAGGAGEAILARLDSDALAAPGAEYLILFIGVNDLGRAFGSFGPRPGGPAPAADAPPPPPPPPEAEVTAETMIAGYRQVIARAHAEDMKIFGATIAPYGGASYWTEEGEAERQAINEWIRTGGEFDGVVDFDAAVRDAADPSRMADGLHMGDFLHGSPAGYAAMAGAIDLDLFQ